jgi:hypothetical protein
VLVSDATLSIRTLPEMEWKGGLFHSLHRIFALRHERVCCRSTDDEHRVPRIALAAQGQSSENLRRKVALDLVIPVRAVPTSARQSSCCAKSFDAK